MTDNPNGLAVRKSYGIYFSCEASWWSVARLSQDEEAIYDAVIRTDNALSSALLSSGKALSSGQNPASQQFLFSKSSQ